MTDLTCEDCELYGSKDCPYYMAWGVMPPGHVVHMLPETCVGFSQKPQPVAADRSLEIPSYHIGFNHEQAAILSSWCRAVYGDNWPLGYPDVNIVRNENAVTWIIHFQDHILIVGRGSDPGFADPKDWRHNLQRFQERDFFNAKIDGETIWCSSGVRVHSGFRKHLDLTWDAIEEMRRKQKPFVITGHSLWGGCATICASRLDWLGEEVSCYPLAMPRSISATHHDHPGVDVTHGILNVNEGLVVYDPVGLVPRIGYQHHHSLRCLHEDGTLVEDLDYWRTFRRRNKYQDPSADQASVHAAAEYERRLWAGVE